MTNTIEQGICYYQVYTNNGSGVYGLEISAMFSREITAGERLEIEVNRHNRREMIPLIVEKVEEGCLYVKQEDTPDDILFCEIVKTPRVPIGHLHLRRKNTLHPA